MNTSGTPPQCGLITGGASLETTGKGSASRASARNYLEKMVLPERFELKHSAIKLLKILNYSILLRPFL